MKMKKLLAFGAVALTITAFLQVSAYSAEFKGDQKAAVLAIAENGVNGKNVINGLQINAKTEIGSYLNEKFINEINSVLQDTGLGQGEKAIAITGKDTFYTIQNKVLAKKAEYKKEYNDFETKIYEDFEKIKTAMNEKIKTLRECKTNFQLEEEIKSIVNYTSYGNLTIGVNGNGSKTISLEKEGKTVVQINSEQVNRVINKVQSIQTYNDLKKIFEELKPILGIQ